MDVGLLSVHTERQDATAATGNAKNNEITFTYILVIWKKSNVQEIHCVFKECVFFLYLYVFIH